MNTKRVAVDFGDKKIDIDVPDHASVVEFEDPPFLQDPAASIRETLAKPYSSPPLAELIKPGMRVAIGFDDITRPNIPPRTILPIIVEELLAKGVKQRDILFVNACSNHRKNTRAELANHLGPEIFGTFWGTGQILNHDCTDPGQLQYFGVTDGGRYVEMNKHFVNADLMIYQGNVAAGAWRSYTGTGVAVGLASTRSIASHHSFHGIPEPAVKVNAEKKAAAAPRKRIPSVKEEMTDYLDQALGRKVFYINSFNGSGGRMAGVFAGYADGVKPPAWELAEKYVRRPTPEADVLIVGLPASYSYGSSNNTLIATVGATVPPRYCPEAPVLREGGVVIACSPANGHIDADRFPSYQPAIDLYARYFSSRDMVDHEDEFDHRPDFRHKYTHGYGYPPLHAFWLFYENEYLLKRAGAVIMAGTPNPGAFRALGLTPARNFDEAWQIAKKYVGANPRTVVAPTFWSKPRIKFDVPR